MEKENEQEKKLQFTKKNAYLGLISYIILALFVIAVFLVG